MRTTVVSLDTDGCDAGAVLVVPSWGVDSLRGNLCASPVADLESGCSDEDGRCVTKYSLKNLRPPNRSATWVLVCGRVELIMVAIDPVSPLDLFLCSQASDGQTVSFGHRAGVPAW